MKLKRRPEAPKGTATRWLGNHNKMIYHDLSLEVEPCQIDLMNPEHMRHFNTDAEAKDAGYDPCDWCVLGLGKKHGYEII